METPSTTYLRSLINSVTSLMLKIHGLESEAPGTRNVFVDSTVVSVGGRSGQVAARLCSTELLFVSFTRPGV